MATIQIDGKTLTVQDGLSLLEAALQNGVYIPHLCHHPDLPELGSCRLCIVEIDGQDGVVPSCMTKVRDGLVVRTRSEQIDHLRKLSMELLQAAHPEDCSTCPKYGNCELQTLIQYMGCSGARMRARIKGFAQIENPLLIHDMNRCVLCGRCVRACNDLRGVHVLQYNKKELETYVGTLQQKLLKDADCRFCGACAEVCPTGTIRDVASYNATEKRDTLIPCQAACPAGTDIPRYIRLAKEGKYAESVAVIREHVPFPLSLGRVCTHACEANCRRGQVNEAISIRDIKRYAVQHDDQLLWKQNAKHLPATGKTVAVVGGGPCGLTAAYYLAKQGHDVTVFERYPTAGGMMAYGIPSYRLPREEVQQEVDYILEVGVKLQCNTDITDVVALKEKYDAVLVAVGASAGKIIPTKNMVDSQCTTAIDVLRDISLGKPTAPEIGPGHKVLVFGGGNVAFDAARCSARLGAEVSVVCLESRAQMLADDEEIEQAQEEGVKVYAGQTNTGFNLDADGKIESLNIIGVSSFRFGPNGLEVETVPGSEDTVPCDIVIYASGQKTDLTPAFGLELNRPGYPVDPETGKSGFKTSVPGVFTAGDVITGTKSVIAAIQQGREAASAIDKLLGGDGDIHETLAPETPHCAEIGTISGFGSLPRVHSDVTPITERAGCFAQVDHGIPDAKISDECSRCLQCDLRFDIHPRRVWTEFTGAEQEVQ